MWCKQAEKVSPDLSILSHRFLLTDTSQFKCDIISLAGPGSDPGCHTALPRADQTTALKVTKPPQLAPLNLELSSSTQSSLLDY